MRKLEILLFVAMVFRLHAGDDLTRLQEKYLPRGSDYNPDLSEKYQEELLVEARDPSRVGLKTFVVSTNQDFDELIADLESRGLEFGQTFDSREEMIALRRKAPARYREFQRNLRQMEERQPALKQAIRELPPGSKYRRVVGRTPEGTLVIVEKPYFDPNENVWIDRTIVRFVGLEEVQQPVPKPVQKPAPAKPVPAARKAK